MADQTDITQPMTPPEIQEVTTSNASHVIISEVGDDPVKLRKAKWYVMHTYASHENKVAETLKQRAETMGLTDFIHEVLIPTQEKIQIRRGNKHQVRERIFPGYVLIRMNLTDEAWLCARTTPGVTGFVGVGNNPTPLPKHEVEAIKKFMSQGVTTYKANFSLGEAVKIVEGPFNDFIGSVDSIDEDKGKVTVLVSIFGRETPVELDFLQVSKL
jgi:transcription termination/antitermination protein NusG